MLAEESFAGGGACRAAGGGGGGSEANSADTTDACDVPGSLNMNLCRLGRGLPELGGDEPALSGGGGGGGGGGGDGASAAGASSDATSEACEVPGSLNMNLCRLGRGLPWGSGWFRSSGMVEVRRPVTCDESRIGLPCRRLRVREVFWGPNTAYFGQLTG